MIWPAVIGAGASLLGSVLGKKKPGGHKFRPQNSFIEGIGSASFKDGKLTTTGTQFDRDARSFFEQQFNQQAADPFGLQQFGGGVIGDAQNLFNPALMDSLQAGFDGSQQALGQFGAQHQSLLSMLGAGGQAGLEAAFGAPSAGEQTNFAMEQARSLFGQTDLNQLAADRTAQLTELARPSEERAVNQKLSGLFGSGRLGTTGGAQAIGQLGQAQEMAATQRGLAGMDFAEQVRQANLARGTGLLGQAFQGVGMDQSRGLQLGQLGAGLLGQQGQFAPQFFDRMMGLEGAQAGRADQRFSRIQDLFGFGQQMFEAPTAGAARALTGTGALDERALAAGDQAIRASGVASGVQGAGGGSPIGGALMGMGQGLFNSYINRQQAQPVHQGFATVPGGSGAIGGT